MQNNKLNLNVIAYLRQKKQVDLNNLFEKKSISETQKCCLIKNKGAFMKKYLLLLIAIFIMACSKDESEEVPEVFPTGYYILDIKTDWMEKQELQGIKAGINNYVDQAHWCEGTNLGEDFEIWLDNLERTKISEKRVKIAVDLVIKKSTTFGATEVSNERVEFAYDMPNNIDDVMLSSEKTKDFINKSIKLSSALSLVGLDFGVSTISLVTIQKLLNFLISSENSDYYKAEALLTGGILGEKIKLFFINYEKEL